MSKPRALVVVSTALVSSPESIARIKETLGHYDVHQQLAERLDENAIVLNANQYDHIQVAAAGNELITMKPHSFEALYNSMRVKGSLQGSIDPCCRPFLVIAGFVHDEQGNRWVKPEATLSVPLARKRNPASTRRLAFKRSANTTAEEASSGTPENTPQTASTPQVMPSLADLGLQTPGEEDIIDEDDLVDGQDMLPALKLPARCDPGPGRKRRKACKDCTCGLKEMEEQEADRQRAAQASVVSLSAGDLAEIDFTVPGKAVGGCGSCALGDAFRCDGCPYLGLPPFKPGEVVTIDGFGDDF